MATGEAILCDRVSSCYELCCYQLTSVYEVQKSPRPESLSHACVVPWNFGVVGLDACKHTVLAPELSPSIV